MRDVKFYTSIEMPDNDSIDCDYVCGLIKNYIAGLANELNGKVTDIEIKEC